MKNLINQVSDWYFLRAFFNEYKMLYHTRQSLHSWTAVEVKHSLCSSEYSMKCLPLRPSIWYRIKSIHFCHMLALKAFTPSFFPPLISGLGVQASSSIHGYEYQHDKELIDIPALSNNTNTSWLVVFVHTTI